MSASMGSEKKWERQFTHNYMFVCYFMWPHNSKFDTFPKNHLLSNENAWALMQKFNAKKWTYFSMFGFHFATFEFPQDLKQNGPYYGLNCTSRSPPSRWYFINLGKPHQSSSGGKSRLNGWCFGKAKLPTLLRAITPTLVHVVLRNLFLVFCEIAFLPWRK